MADEYDWTRIQDEPCPECGFDPTTVLVGDLARAIQADGVAWSEWLEDAAADPDVDLRSRPDAGVWSPLEYACHVRDVLALFTLPWKQKIGLKTALYDADAHGVDLYFPAPALCTDNGAMVGAVAVTRLSQGVEPTPWDADIDPGMRLGSAPA